MGKKLRILVLDDDDVRHEIWGKLFTEAGHEVTHVHTMDEFEDALFIGSPKYDLLFLDHDLNDYPSKYKSVGASGRKLTGKSACHCVTMLPVDKHPKTVVIHSWNDDAAPVMWNILRNDPTRTYKVVVKPFPYVLWKRHEAHKFEIYCDSERELYTQPNFTRVA